MNAAVRVLCGRRSRTLSASEAGYWTRCAALSGRGPGVAGSADCSHGKRDYRECCCRGSAFFQFTFNRERRAIQDSIDRGLLLAEMAGQEPLHCHGHRMREVTGAFQGSRRQIRCSRRPFVAAPARSVQPHPMELSSRRNSPE